MLPIYRNSGNSQSPWTRTTAQIPRNLETVTTESKEPFINDLMEYLKPSSRDWYANRGLPDRRGYLFHGPPGTGKPSLCIAAAGALGLKICIMNLHSMTDDKQLIEAFASVPKFSVVLVEDADAMTMTNSRATNSVTKPSFSRKEDLSKDSRNLSLSSLLNAIDGVDAPEGRILIMTTNHLDKLDPALVRPGRVDQVIKFDYPGHDSIKSLFQNIYSPANTHPEWLDLANSFAAAVANKKLSQADIQCYLLQYKDKPEDAVEGVSAWLEKRSVAE